MISAVGNEQFKGKSGRQRGKWGKVKEGHMPPSHDNTNNSSGKSQWHRLLLPRIEAAMSGFGKEHPRNDAFTYIYM